MERKAPLGRLLGWALPVLLSSACALAGGLGCTSHEGADAGPAASAAPLDPLPAPPGLLATLSMPTPEASWAKVRALVGAPVFIPQSIGGVATTMLGLPITVAGEFDGEVPLVGAFVSGTGKERPRAVIGIHVKVGERLVDQLTKGEGARFTARLDPATHITCLDSKSGGKGSAEMGVLGNYLLVGLAADDVTVVGPYVARTLSVAAPPKEDIAIEIPDSALSGPILDVAKAAWQKMQRVQRPEVAFLPFGELVDGAIELLGDMTHARATIEFDKAAAHLRLTGVPKPGSGPAGKAVAEMLVGDGQPLLELPATTLAGILWRESAEAKTHAAAAQATAVGAYLGKDAAGADGDAIAAALRGAAEARGTWAVGGLSFGPAGPTGYVHAAVTDQDKMTAALQGLVALTKLPSVKAKLKGAQITVTSGKTVVENLPGDVQRVRFEHHEKDEKAATATKKAVGDTTPSAIDLLYLLKKDALFASAGLDAKEGLRGVLAGPGGSNLGSIASLKAAVEGLGGDASFVLEIDPVRLLASRSGRPGAEAAPVLLAAGRSTSPGMLWARVDLAGAAMQDLMRLGAGGL
jgi:hypothetical protein